MVHAIPCSSTQESPCAAFPTGSTLPHEIIWVAQAPKGSWSSSEPGTGTWGQAPSPSSKLPLSFKLKSFTQTWGTSCCCCVSHSILASSWPPPPSSALVFGQYQQSAQSRTAGNQTPQIPAVTEYFHKKLNIWTLLKNFNAKDWSSVTYTRAAPFVIHSKTSATPSWRHSSPSTHPRAAK